MAKKFVRGVTGVDDIESFDKSLTNVNDLISDGQNTYVHTKKGKVESYYNLTDSVKQVQSTDDLLTIIKQDNTVLIVNKGFATTHDLETSKLYIDNLLAQKQNTIVNNGSIAPSSDGLRQLLTDYQTYTNINGFLKTYSKWISFNISPDTQIFEEVYFTVKINKGATSATFTLNNNDKIKFNKIITSYGENNTVRINGCIFTLSGSDLTVTTSNNVDNNYVITFSNII